VTRSTRIVRRIALALVIIVTLVLMLVCGRWYVAKQRVTEVTELVTNRTAVSNPAKPGVAASGVAFKPTAPSNTYNAP